MLVAYPAPAPGNPPAHTHLHGALLLLLTPQVLLPDELQLLLPLPLAGGPGGLRRLARRLTLPRLQLAAAAAAYKEHTRSTMF